MEDERVHRVYGVRLLLGRPGDDLDGLHQRTLQATWLWGRRGPDGWPLTWTDGELVHDDIRLLTVSHEDSRQAAHRLRLEHPDTGNPDLSWRTTIDIVRMVDRVEAACSVEQQRKRDVITPEHTLPATPRIVRTLVSAGARSGRHALSTKVDDVSGADAVEDLVEGILLDPERRVPVVVVTSLASADGSYAVPSASIAALAERLAGLAHVVTLSRKLDTFELTKRLGSRLSVFNGAVRVYWPRFSTMDDPYRHPLLFADRLSTYHFEAIGQEIVDSAVRAFRDHDGASVIFSHARIEQERIQSQKRLRANRSLKQELSAALQEVETWSLLAEEYEAEKSSLQVRLNEMAEDNSALTDKLKALQFQFQKQAGAASTNSVSSPVATPGSFAEAIESAVEHYSSTLTITDPARREALKMNSADNSPNKLWSALSALHEAVAEWQAGDVGHTISTALMERGFPVSSTGRTAVGQHAQSYKFRWQGKVVSVGPHIDLSRGERIYWYQDDRLRRFVINHIGSHLPDSTT